MTTRLVRLSSWVFFIDQPDGVDVCHAACEATWRVSLSTAHALRQHRGFRPLSSALTCWHERGVLVSPGEDAARHCPPSPGSEAALSSAILEWYWRCEPDIERGYQWLGHPVVKMPQDLFLYQELIATRRAQSILEVGVGYGGGLWFLGTILQMVGGGHLIGIEREPCSQLPPLETLTSVRLDLVTADARRSEAQAAIRLLEPDGLDLIIIDAGETIAQRLALLEQWMALVGKGGCIVVEDVVGGSAESARQVSCALDGLLIERTDFGVLPMARRFSGIKSDIVCLERIGVS